MEVLDKLTEGLKLFSADVAHVHTETALEPELGSKVDDLQIDERLKNSLTAVMGL
jgi:DEAD/DEAH box helicase domain-containing protein